MDGPKGERSESSSDFEAVKALGSSFRWNDGLGFYGGGKTLSSGH